MQTLLKLTLTTITLITLTACNTNEGKGKQNSEHGLINVPPKTQSQTLKTDEDTQPSITLKATDEITVVSNKKDMGAVELLDDDKLRDTRYGNLHLYGVVKDESMKKLDLLRLCSKNKCWSVIDKSHPLVQKDKKQISQNYSTFLIGKMVFKDMNETIESIEYKYNGKQGVLKLKDKLYFAQAVIDVMYLKFDEKLKEYLVTTASPTGYVLYVPDDNCEYRTNQDVTISADKDLIQRPAILEFEPINYYNNNEKVSVFSTVIEFSILPPLSEDEMNQIIVGKQTARKIETVDRLQYPMRISIPITKKDINTDQIKSQYSFQINGSDIEYHIESIGNQDYILFETNQASCKIDFSNKKGVVQ